MDLNSSNHVQFIQIESKTKKPLVGYIRRDETRRPQFIQCLDESHREGEVNARVIFYDDVIQKSSEHCRSVSYSHPILNSNQTHSKLAHQQPCSTHNLHSSAVLPCPQCPSPSRLHQFISPIEAYRARAVGALLLACRGHGHAGLQAAVATAHSVPRGDPPSPQMPAATSQASARRARGSSLHLPVPAPTAPLGRRPPSPSWLGRATRQRQSSSLA